MSTVTYGLKEVYNQPKFSSNSISYGDIPLVLSPTKYYFFEAGDGSESSDARLVRCVKGDTGWGCESVLQETGGWWISVSHLYDIVRQLEIEFGDWAVVPNPKLWVVNSQVQTYTYGTTNNENLGISVYLADYGKIITGGECSGNKIRLINPSNNWAEEASWTFSWLSGQSYGKIDIIPRTDGKLYVLGGIGTASSSPHNAIIGEVDIEDLMDNPNSNIDQLGSWNQIKDFGEPPKCGVTHGYHGIIHLSLANSGYVSYDPVTDTTIQMSTTAHMHYGDSGYAIYDSTNKVLTLYDKSGNQVAQISNLNYDGFDYARDVNWFAIARNGGNTSNALVAITINGYTPIPEIDVTNKKFRIIDFHTGNPVAFQVKLVWSKAGNGFVSPIVTDTTKVQTMTVSDWTSIPNAPASGNWFLTILPTVPA